MWNTVLEVLERKVRAGVEVRLIYDDVGSVFLLPKEYNKIMENKGIQCVAFNRLIPFMSLVLNNRDHRKIVVIDGKVGYTGGINMADEYINYTHPHGDHWKDAGIRIEGKRCGISRLCFCRCGICPAIQKRTMESTAIILRKFLWHRDLYSLIWIRRWTTKLWEKTFT